MKEIMDNGPVQGKMIPVCACVPDKYTCNKYFNVSICPQVSVMY